MSKRALPEPVPVMNVPYNPRNPYQQLLYSEAVPRYRIVRGSPGFLFGADDEAGLPRGGIVHLHWEESLFTGSAGVEDMAARAHAGLAVLERFRADGGTLLWTVHNRYPHRYGDSETFRRVRQRLCRLADAIHVHTPHAADHMIAEYGSDPSKLHVIPHPSYLGVYESAAATLGRSADFALPRHFLFFGMARPQKGADTLLSASDILRRHRVPFQLSFAGRAFPPLRRRLRRRALAGSITARTDRVPDAEVAPLFGAAHVFVAPYRDLFTSGTVALAQTFGLPVLGPDMRELRDAAPAACHDLLYDPRTSRALIRAMKRTVAMDAAALSAYRAACLEWAVAHAPAVISQRIGSLLDRIRR